MSATALAQKGHNNPPSDIEIVADRMLEQHPKLFDHANQLLRQCEALPTACDDDETAGALGDLVKTLTGVMKTLESHRVKEKEPHLAMSRAVDGFFKSFTERLEAAKRTAQKPVTEFLNKKALAEQARRNEEARLAREEADRQLAAAIQADAERRAAEEANKPAAPAEAMTQQLEVAAHTEAHAVHLEQKAAESRPADLSRTRSIGGSVASLRTVWVGEITDRASLDLEALREHIPLDALQKAINSFVKAGGRELAGAVIKEKSEAVIR